MRFADYARAMLRNDELEDPEDKHGNRSLMRKVFHHRGLCVNPFEDCERNPKNCLLTLDKPPSLPISHDIFGASRSKTDAYHLIHDNRDVLGIPQEQDFVIADVYQCNKRGGAAQRLPRQLVLQYVWREEVELEGERFGSFAGETMHLLCGGTLVFDDQSNLLWWTAKRGRGTSEGEDRRTELLDYIAWVIADRRLSLIEDPEAGIPNPHPAAVVARRVGGALRLETAPHLCGKVEEEVEWATSF